MKGLNFYEKFTSFFVLIAIGAQFFYFAPNAHASLTVSVYTPPPLENGANITNDPLSEKQEYLKQIHAPEAWALSTGSVQVTVAILDSGVDINHPDLKNNIWQNSGEIPGDGIDNDNNEAHDRARDLEERFFGSR